MKKSLMKNIFMELGFLTATGLAWYLCLSLAFIELDTTFGMLIISFIYMSSTIAYAFFADKWWNIPCMLYMVFMTFTALLYIADPILADDLIVWVFFPLAGIDFITSIDDTPFSVIVIIFSSIVLTITAMKYLPRKKKQ